MNLCSGRLIGVPSLCQTIVCFCVKLSHFSCQITVRMQCCALTRVVLFVY